MVSLMAGSLVVFLGVLRAMSETRSARQITDHARLGLEFFVAATILNLMLNPTWTAVALTALTIAVRQLIAFSLSLARGG